MNTDLQHPDNRLTTVAKLIEKLSALPADNMVVITKYGQILVEPDDLTKVTSEASAEWDRLRNALGYMV